MSERDDALPCIDPEAVVPDRRRRVVGLLLAGGTSNRYGDGNKLLEPVAGTPVIRHAVEPLLAADLAAVQVVLGHQAPRVRSALEDTPVSCVRNTRFEEGMAASLRTGIEALDQETEAVVIALGDMPAVRSSSIRALVRVYRSGKASALAAAFEGQRGNPVLFDRRHFADLRAIEGDRGGRGVFQAIDDAALIETGDPGVRLDLDTPADRARIESVLDGMGET